MSASDRRYLRNAPEHWERVEEFPDYWVSNHGHVQNFRTRHDMALTQNHGNVVKVNFRQGGKLHTRSVAVLVAELFVTPPHPFEEESDTPIHLNGDPTDNHWVNLAWRPRWFAWKYTRQFNIEQVYDYHFPVFEKFTNKRFDTVMEAGVDEGVLWEHIATAAAWNSTAPEDAKRLVYPTGGQYEWV